MIAEIFLAAVAAGVALWAWRQVQRARRGDFIRRYMFPPGLLAKLRQRYPHFRAREEQYTARALRRFFLAYLHGAFAPVAMPSRVADELWHEFILYTKAYDEFCRKAFGRFLHHTPAAVLAPAQKKSNEGLRRVWWQACKEERVDPWAPQKLPLLFAIDGELNIANGYRYVPDCGGVRTVVSVEVSRTQCGGDFSSTSYDGGTDGMGDGGGGDGDGGGGCGGD